MILDAAILTCKICNNKKCFIKNHCSSKWHSLIDSQRTSICYNKNDQILHQGNLATGIFFIYSGKAKVFNSGLHGNKHIIRLLTSGDVLGHSGYGGREFSYSKSAVALEDSIICFIRKETFFKALKANHELTFNMMMFYAETLKKTEMQLNNMAKMNAKEKVASALLFIKESLCENCFELTRQDIGNIAGVTQEQVSRILTCFDNANLIEREKSKIRIINEQKLKEITSSLNDKNKNTRKTALKT